MRRLPQLTAALFAASILAMSAGGAQAAPPAGATFTLRPGDIVRISVSRDTTISGEFPVDERGRVVLPLIGPRLVTHAPWPDVRDSLGLALGAELNDPAVRITPLRRVFVLGFVQEPGTYFADPTVPIIGAISLAGGASPEGDLRRIRVVRNGALLMARASADSPAVLADILSGDQIYVDRRGWFDRNAPFFVSALVGVASIIVTLIVTS